MVVHLEEIFLKQQKKYSAMNQFMVTIILFTFTVVIVHAQDDESSNNCNRAINAFVDECQSVRSMLSKENSKDEKVICW